MDLQKVLKNKGMIILSIFIGHFFIDFYSNIIPPVLYLFSEKLSLTLAQQGMVSAFIIAFASIFQPVVGYFTDRKTEGWLLVVAVAWMGLFMCLTAIINNYYILLAAVALGGLASSIYHPLGSALTIKLSDRAKGTSLSSFLVVGGLAIPAAPAIVLPLTNIYGLNALVYLLIPGIIAVIFMYFSGVHKITIEQHEAKNEVKSKLSTYKAKWLFLLIVIPTARNIVFRTIVTFGIQYMLLKNITLSLGGLAITMFLFAEPIGTFLGGFFGDRLGHKNVLIVSGILGAISAILAFWSQGIVTLLSLVLMSFFFCLSNTPTVFITQSLIPKNTNLATGLVFGLPMGLGGIGAVAFGKIADSVGLIVTAKYLIIPVIIMICIILMIPKEWKEA